MSRTARVAAAGVAAALAWVAVEPGIRRVTGGRHTETLLIGRMVAPEALSGPVGLGVHLVNGAAFAVGFDRLGGRGVRQAVAAAQIENALLWPLTGVIDSLHPDVRDGTWPPLLRDRNAFAQEVAGHAVFGAVLGVLLPRRD